MLYGPRTQTCGETNYLNEKIEFRKVGYLIKILSYSVLGSNTMVKAIKSVKKMVKRPTIQQPGGAVHFSRCMSSDGYFLHRTEHSVAILAISG